MNPRSTGGAAALLCLAALASPTAAAPYTASVTADLAEVRAGPSPSYPATGTVRRGDTVRVVGESNGWLAVEPPQGSRSFVCGRFLMFVPGTPRTAGAVAVVQLPGGTPVRAGGDRQREPFDVEVAKLPLGTQVRIAGPSVPVPGDGEWWPVEPTPQERRYLPPGSVGPAGDLGPGPSRPSPAAAAPTAVAALPAAPATPASADAARPSRELWDLAVQAEQAGNETEARRLLDVLARRVDQPGDADLAARALNRIAQLDRFARPRDVPLTTVARPGSSPAAVTPASRVTAAPPAPVAAPAGAITARGQLRSSPYRINGQPAFALENPGGERWYAVAAPGVKLGDFLNLAVDVTGREGYDGASRARYLVVESVRYLK
jgi:hypothetical protein